MIHRSLLRAIRLTRGRTAAGSLRGPSKSELERGQHPWIYDAFLSYSHASDAQTVRELRASIESFGRPLLRARSFLVWHDRASLSMTDALWHEIAAALDQSRSLL